MESQHCRAYRVFFMFMYFKLARTKEGIRREDERGRQGRKVLVPYVAGHDDERRLQSWL